MKKISVIRERGQLTIPDSIRQVVGWVAPMSAVSISVVKPDEIVIKPHQQKVDWNRLWKLIKKSRSLGIGRATSSAAEFLEKDRRSH
ncbi:MAG: hypothetical protein Q8P83_01675 [bacterium]|nr:hypothetical protein [bacterium]